LIVEITASAANDNQGGAFLVMRDVTRRKHREDEIKRIYENLNLQLEERTRELAVNVDELALANEELQKLDKMRSEFVSLVSHQIRAPLTNMRGAVTQMETGCVAVNTTCNRMFTILNEQVVRLDTLVGDLLGTSQIEAGELVIQKEPISVMPVIRKVIEQSQARLSGREIQLPTKPGLPLVFADRDRVAEILANFLDNADKYSPPGSDLDIGLRADQSEVVISVRDHGPGLTPTEMERVFEKFYRSDSSDAQSTYGHGLGLYVCRLLAEEQGGRVWAENHPEGGAEFSLSLPVWQDENGRF
ncbi:MAG: sensor histidine kinase, partial [Anaerolineales bacterium]